MKKTISIILGAGVLTSMVSTKGAYSSFDNDGCDTDNINFGIDEGSQFDSFGAQASQNSKSLKSHDDYLGFNNKSSDNVGKAVVSNDCGCDEGAIFTPSVAKNNNKYVSNNADDCATTTIQARNRSLKLQLPYSKKKKLYDLWLCPSYSTC